MKWIFYVFCIHARSFYKERIGLSAFSISFLKKIIYGRIGRKKSNLTWEGMGCLLLPAYPSAFIVKFRIY
ncbi:MAG: hypothetical protein DRN29_09740 [Thermoplasmata archaeon]|nr:MAG: hypothetical protein DRN29_09740 [Thermoplasmata archaeon]